MIKFHYFEWPAADVRKRGLPVSPKAEGMIRCCHVYSDESAAELRAWGRENGIARRWLQGGRRRLLHFDLWGARLALCGEGVGDREFAAVVLSARLFS